jgi:hypothetical protein
VLHAQTELQNDKKGTSHDFGEVDTEHAIASVGTLKLLMLERRAGRLGRDTIEQGS